MFGVEERAVPQSALPGEWLSPTQPFPVAPEPLLPLKVTPDDAWGFTFWGSRALSRENCIAALGGRFHTTVHCSRHAAHAWYCGRHELGGPAYDPARQVMIVNVTNVPQVVILVPREKIPDVRGISLTAGNDVAEQRGTPYGARREWLLSPWGAPCVKPPWGELVAVRMTDGKVLWRKPLGSIEKQLPIRVKWNLGTPNIGGPIVTAGGLIFIGATMDGYLRAFNVEDGEELWREQMPAGTQATPMTYEAGGRQS